MPQHAARCARAEPGECVRFEADALERQDRLLADEAYLREAILNPSQHITQGYAPIMPTYQGQVSEEGVIALVEYIKNLDSDYRVQQTTNTTDLLPESEGRRQRRGSRPQSRRRDGEAMSDTIISLPDQSTARIPKVNFLTQGERPAELAADRRSQADRDSVSDLDYVLLLYRRSAGGPDPPGAADAAVRSDGDGHL